MHSHSVPAQPNLKSAQLEVDFPHVSANRISTAYKKPTWYHILLFLLAPFGLGIFLGILNVALYYVMGASSVSGEPDLGAVVALWFLDWAIIMGFRFYTVVRTGYRAVDFFRFFIPGYNIYFSCVVWWRYTSLPYAYWEGDVVSHNELRRKVFKDAVRRGAPNRLADLTSYALVPLEDRQRPTARYAHELQEMVVHTTSAVRSIPSNDHLQGVVIDAIQSYALLARDCGELWYFNKFTSLLTKYGITPLASWASTAQPQGAQPQAAQWAAPNASSPQPVAPHPAPVYQAPVEQPTWPVPAAPQLTWGTPVEAATPAATFPTIPPAPTVTPPAAPASAPDPNRPSWMPPQQ